jgi:hypothetical protein
MISRSPVAVVGVVSVSDDPPTVVPVVEARYAGTSAAQGRLAEKDPVGSSTSVVNELPGLVVEPVKAAPTVPTLPNNTDQTMTTTTANTAPRRPAGQRGVPGRTLIGHTSLTAATRQHEMTGTRAVNPKVVAPLQRAKDALWRQLRVHLLTVWCRLHRRQVTVAGEQNPGIRIRFTSASAFGWNGWVRQAALR